MSLTHKDLLAAARAAEFSSRIRKLSFLIIEDQEPARNTLRGCAITCGAFHVAFALSYTDAIFKIRKNPDYDIILCDYNLGNGRSGQQLLEEVRLGKLISERAVWIMVTSEQAYEQVVSAVELAPDDYVLKPFSANVLLSRIEKALTKHDFFTSYYKADPDSLPARMNALVELAKKPDSKRYGADIMRKRADELSRHGRPKAAIAVFDQIISDVYPFPWARAGKARALMKMELFKEAEAEIASVVVEKPDYFEAHDIQAQALTAMGDVARAQRILEHVTERTPRNYQRKRMLSQVALINGDVETANRVMTEVLEKDVVATISVEDVMSLARSKITCGDKAGALAAIAKIPPEKAISIGQSDALALTCIEVCADSETAVAKFKSLCCDLRSDNLEPSEMVDAVRAALYCHEDDLANQLALDLLSDTTRARSVFRLLARVYTDAGKKDALRLIQERVAQILISKQRLLKTAA